MTKLKDMRQSKEKRGGGVCVQKAVRAWELPFTESREGHQEANKYAYCPHTGRVVQTPGLQASIGLEMSVIRELLGEFGDVWGCLERCRDCC